jgi:hypothetical protein
LIPTHDGTPRIADARVVTIDDRAECMVLRCVGGMCFHEVRLPHEAADEAEVGDSTTLFLDEHERPLGWSIPGKKIGLIKEVSRPGDD